MEMSYDELERFLDGHGRKDVQMALQELQIKQLKQQVEQVAKERDMWQARALQYAVVDEDKHGFYSRFIVISKQKLKGLVTRICDADKLGFLCIILQKCLHDGASNDECRAIMDAIQLPTPQPQSISVKTEGDTHITMQQAEVKGAMYEISGNNNVNLSNGDGGKTE